MKSKTMPVVVKFFASLRDELGRDEAQIEYVSGMKVVDIWQQVAGNQPMPGHVLAAVNMEYARPETVINDGDEVAFFPPVTGG